MAEALTRCPRIAVPCESLPAFERGQKLAFCGLCRKHVHNWNALSLTERARLLAGQLAPCVRYAMWVPAGAALLLGAAQAQESDDTAQELDEIVITGGMVIRTEPDIEVFLESDPAADAWLDEEGAR